MLAFVLATLTGQRPVHLPDSASVEHLAYGPDPAQALDLYVPAGPSNGILVVFVHGGAWQSGSRHEYDAACASLQRQGVASATVDYRLSPRVQHPDHAWDSAKAVAFLRSHPKGFDPKRIVLVGHSAGGHILATIATAPGLLALAKPAGFVGLEGIYDVPNLAQRWPAYPNWFLNRAFTVDRTFWPTASPTRQKLASRAPWLLVHSMGDELVDAAQTDGFAAHLKASGVKTTVLHPNAGSHSAVVSHLATPNDPVMKAILSFARGAGFSLHKGPRL